MNLRMYGTDGTTIVRLADGSYTRDRRRVDVLASRIATSTSGPYRSNVVLKWEWRPGSTLYVVWQQNRASQTDEGSTSARATCSARLGAPATTSSPSRARSGSRGRRRAGSDSGQRAWCSFGRDLVA